MKYMSEYARAASPYVAGEQPKMGGLIKLNTNENPYSPSPRAAQAISEAVERLPLYPPADGLPLRQAVAEREGVPVEWTFAGNGSDEVLAFAFRAFFDEEMPVVTPEVGYSFYPVYARLFDIPHHKAPMLPGLFVDVQRLKGEHGVVLANPNAPTSLALSLKQIQDLCAHLHARGRVLVVDEAYYGFGSETARALVFKYDNLLVVRTLSKSHSMAGIRAGYAIGQSGLIEALTRIKDSFNSYPLDHLALAGARAALLDEEYFARCAQKVMDTRAWFSSALLKMGFTVPDSKANFVFVSHPEREAALLFEGLRSRGILVRHFDAPLTREYLRISIGTQPQMEEVARALADLVRP